MTEKQKKFLRAINRLIPQLTELDQERLLAFGEGLAFVNGAREQEQATAQDSA